VAEGPLNEEPVEQVSVEDRLPVEREEGRPHSAVEDILQDGLAAEQVECSPCRQARPSLHARHLPDLVKCKGCGAGLLPSDEHCGVCNMPAKYQAVPIVPLLLLSQGRTPETSCTETWREASACSRSGSCSSSSSSSS
jgi:hypothetical protein